MNGAEQTNSIEEHLFVLSFFVLFQTQIQEGNTDKLMWFSIGFQKINLDVVVGRTMAGRMSRTVHY